MQNDALANRGDVLVLIAALIWGLAFYFQKTAMWYIGPLLFVGLRGLVAALALIPFAIVEQRKRSFPYRAVLPIAVGAGFVFCLAAVVQQYGLITATVINTGFLTALYVVITPFLYWAVHRHAPGSTVWVAVTLAFVGIWALGGGGLGEFSRGDALVAGAAFVWSAHIVITEIAARHAQPLTFTCIKFAVVGVVALSLAIAFEPIVIDAIFDAWQSILYVGVLSGAVTFGFMAYALRFIPAPRATVLLSVETLFSASAGYLLLGERLSVIGWVGGLLILSAVVVVRWRPDNG